MRKTAIILFNLGGPDNLNSVKPFLFNLFNDKAIIDVPQPFRWIIAKLISSRREPIAREIYADLGGKSPLLENTEIQALALERELQKTRAEDCIRCFIAMRYWHPMADEVAAKVKEWGADVIVLLPLYPQYSVTTTGSSFADWHRASAKYGLTEKIHSVCCYPDDRNFVGAITAKLCGELATIENMDTIRVLFTAHGLPQKVVNRGDPYQLAVERTVGAVVNEIGIDGLDWVISYQSRVGPLEWIKPYTDDEIRRAGSEGKGLIVVPIAFVSEHSETLVELDIEYRKLAEESGVVDYRRVRTVSDDNLFITGLKSLIEDALDRDAGLYGPYSARICPSSCTQCPVLR